MAWYPKLERHGFRILLLLFFILFPGWLPTTAACNASTLNGEAGFNFLPATFCTGFSI
jgi:hypothetical protein